MSLAYIRISNSPSSSSLNSAAAVAPTAAAAFGLCASRCKAAGIVSTTIRSAQSDGGQLRRPSIATPPVKPSSPVPLPTAAAQNLNSVTMEFQRQRAKELQEYFKQKKLQEANQGPFFGFIAKNEISNGRWAMFGFAVGMLTEYATGSDFVDQVKILLSNFGILDLE